MQNLDAFNFIDLDLVLLNTGSTWNFCKTYAMSLYQGDKHKYVITCNYESNPPEVLNKKFSCKDS